MNETMNTPQLSYWELRHRIAQFGTCCGEGVRRACVCRLSIVCATHGSMCIGTHD